MNINLTSFVRPIHVKEELNESVRSVNLSSSISSISTQTELIRPVQIVTESITFSRNIRKITSNTKVTIVSLPELSVSERRLQAHTGRYTTRTTIYIKKVETPRTSATVSVWHEVNPSYVEVIL